MEIQLKRFDIREIKDDKVVVLIGKRDTGKSFLCKDILSSVGCYQVEKLGPQVIKSINGDFFNVTDVVKFPEGNLGLNKTVKQDNKIDDKEAA